MLPSPKGCILIVKQLYTVLYSYFLGEGCSQHEGRLCDKSNCLFHILGKSINLRGKKARFVCLITFLLTAHVPFIIIATN